MRRFILWIAAISDYLCDWSWGRSTVVALFISVTAGTGAES